MTASKDIKELKKHRDMLSKVKTEVYSRIVGYYRPVSNWNIGKAQEFIERVLFKTPEKMPLEAEKTATGPVEVFLFWKNSCPSCSIPKAWVVANTGLVTVINVDENPEYIDKYNLRATPTLVLASADTIELVWGTSEIISVLELIKKEALKK